MSLYTRITGEDEPRIPINVLFALLNELGRGKVTRADLNTALGLSAGEITELTGLIGRGVTADELYDILLIAEHRATPTYRTEASLKTRLGV